MTCPLLPDDVTIMILNQLGYNTLDLNQLGSLTSMRNRVELRIIAAVSVISLYSYITIFVKIYKVYQPWFRNITIMFFLFFLFVCPFCFVKIYG